MRGILVLAYLSGCSSAFAITINVSPDRSSPDGVVNSFYLDAMNDTFDSIRVVILPLVRAELLNPDPGLDGFRPRGAGEEFSFINPLLGAATAQGGEGWILSESYFGPDALRLEGGPLDSTIESSESPGLFLANIMLPRSGGFWSVDVIVANQGQTIWQEGFCFCPEPSTMSWAYLALVGVVTHRRRN